MNPEQALQYLINNASQVIPVSRLQELQSAIAVLLPLVKPQPPEAAANE